MYLVVRVVSLQDKLRLTIQRRAGEINRLEIAITIETLLSLRVYHIRIIQLSGSHPRNAILPAQCPIFQLQHYSIGVVVDGKIQNAGTRNSV